MRIPPAVRRVIDQALAWPPIVQLRAVVSAHNEAGGALLAAGLAYGALFAAMTGLLVAAGLVGFMVHDPDTRERLVREIGRQVPPLQPIVRDGLQTVAANAGTFSILGVAGLVWSSSQFYGSLDSAFARIFKMAPQRGAIARIVRGLISLVVVGGGLTAAISTSAVHAVLANRLPRGPAGDATRLFLGIAFPVLTVVFVVLAVGLVYRLVPNAHVPWRALRPPAAFAGLALAVLAELYVFIAPRMLGALSVFGGLAAVFATLIWLSWAFRVLLIGAAWTRERMPEPGAIALPSRRDSAASSPTGADESSNEA